MYTIVESPVYARKATDLLGDEAREAIAAYLALNPTAGSVVQGSGGLRKLRWGSGHGGKRGGLRLIYFNRLEQGQILLLTISSKRRLASFSSKELIQIRKAIEDGN